MSSVPPAAGRRTDDDDEDIIEETGSETIGSESDSDAPVYFHYPRAVPLQAHQQSGGPSASASQTELHISDVGGNCRVGNSSHTHYHNERIYHYHYTGQTTGPSNSKAHSKLDPGCHGPASRGSLGITPTIPTINVHIHINSSNTIDVSQNKQVDEKKDKGTSANHPFRPHPQAAIEDGDCGGDEGDLDGDLDGQPSEDENALVASDESGGTYSPSLLRETENDDDDENAHDELQDPEKLRDDSDDTNPHRKRSASMVTSPPVSFPKLRRMTNTFMVSLSEGEEL